MITVKFLKYRQTYLTVLCAICLIALSLLNSQSSWLKSATGTPLAASAENNGMDDAAKKALIRENYGKLPLSFEANQGQTDRRVKFLSRGQGYTFFLTANEAVMELRRADAGQSSIGDAQTSVDSQAARRSPQSSPQSATLRMTLVGANKTPRIAGADELPGKSNYFLGSNSSEWQTDVRNYARVKYQGVYPGIDAVYYGNQQQLEYDFIVAPGADPKRIRLNLAGARKLRLDEQGDLLIETAAGEVRQHRPVVYQEVDGRRQQVAGSYLLRGQSEVAFEIGAYDASRALVIDPVLSYATLLGDGQGGDESWDITVDAAGNAYVTGGASAVPGFPTTPGAIRSTPEPHQYPVSSQYIFVTKFNPQGNQLVYSALIGATRGILTNTSRGPRYVLNNRGQGLAVDAAGNVFVTGDTVSANFPTTPGAFKTTYDGRPTNTEQNDATGEAFVLKLNALGNGLIYSTLLGGNKGDTGRAVVVDAQGNAHVTGTTDSLNFSTTPGTFQPQSAKEPNDPNQTSDGFVVKLNSTGTALVYSTLLSSGSNEIAYGLALDAAGNVYATGSTSDGYSGTCCPLTTRFPLTPGAYRTAGTLGGAYVVKLNPAGGAIYSALLGGAERTADHGPVVAIDAAGHAYVAGFTRSALFPTTPGAYRRTGLSENPSAPRGSGFITKLAPNGASLIYSTLLGEPNEQPNLAEKEPSDIAVDGAGNVYITGRQFGALVEKLNTTGSALLYSYLFPASEAKGLALDGQGGVYFTGYAGRGFVATPGAYRESLVTAQNVRSSFVAKISEISATGLPLPLPAVTPTPTPPNTDPKTIGGRIVDANLDGVAGVEVKLFSSGALLRTETTSRFGYYGFPEMPYGGNYTVIPSKTSYSFTPQQRVFETLTDHAEASFTALPSTSPTPTPGTTFTISGRVTTLTGQPIAGVAVNISGALGRDQTTGSDGSYSFTNLPLGGPYIVQAIKPGTQFHPEAYAFERLSANQTATFVTWPTVQALTNLSAASYADKLAADSIVTAFGLNLATATQVATSNPLPTSLAGTSVKVRDALGVERAAPLFFVSPTQVNYLTPPGTAAGLAIVSITNGNGATSSALAEVEPVAPGLFTADASGRGLAAAVALRIKANGEQSYEPVARYDTVQNKTVAVPIDLGPASDQVFLIFYGTGFRHRSAMNAVTAQIGGASGVSAPVMFAGEQGGFAGLDQANVLLPRALVGRGEVNVQFGVDARDANAVKVWIK